MKGPTRREILIAAASAGLAGGGTLLARRPHSILQGVAAAASSLPAPEQVGESLLALTHGEYATLSAAVERIYPRDDTPGAIDLGVPGYIDRALASAPLPSWSDGLLTALARLDNESFRRFAVPFANAKPADQDALLADWAGADGGDNPRCVRDLTVGTLEGVLGDPTHGGNKDRAGWNTFSLRADPFCPSESAR